MGDRSYSAALGVLRGVSRFRSILQYHRTDTHWLSALDIMPILEYIMDENRSLDRVCKELLLWLWAK